MMGLACPSLNTAGPPGLERTAFGGHPRARRRPRPPGERPAITAAPTPAGEGATTSPRVKTGEARQLRAQVLEPKRAGFPSQLGRLPAVWPPGSSLTSRSLSVFI